MSSTFKVTQSDIYLMIVRSIIHVDLNAAAIAEPETVHVFAARETMIAFHASKAGDRFERGIVELAPGKKLMWDGRIWTVLNLGENIITLQSTDKQMIEVPLKEMERLILEGKIGRAQDDSSDEMHDEVKRRLAAASPESIARANRIVVQVREFLFDGCAAPADIPERTFRSWVEAYLAAEREYGYGYIGVLDQTNLRGNHEPWNALPEDTRKEMLAHIRDHYDDVRQKGKYSCWADLKLTIEDRFKKACEGKTEEEVNAMAPPRVPSLSTYAAAVNNEDPVEQTRRRRGKRAAYQKQPWYWSLTIQTPKHGDRAWEIGHIDHTKCDVRVRYEDQIDETGRPWWTTLTDAYTRRILAMYLTWDPPSYRSCMMVVQECVRRFGRLPQIVIVDHGSEFESTYFDELLSMYRVTKKIRPEAEPRSGSTAERTFGTANSQFFHNLLANTQASKEPRTMVKSHDPAELSVWTFLRLSERIEEYSYEVYDTLEHPALHQSPRKAFDQSVARSSEKERTIRRIVYGQDFLMLTLPTTKKKTAKVLERGLINVNYITYWNDMLRDPRLCGKQLHVRYNPFDAGVAWVYANKMWIKCHSTHYAQLCGKSEKLIRIITLRIREWNKRFPQLRLTVNAVTIARFLRDLRNDEEVLLQARRDRESQQARDRHFKFEVSLLVTTVVDASTPKPPQSAAPSFEPIPRRQRKARACEVFDADF